MDTADFEAGCKIRCPSLILWGREESHPPRVRRAGGPGPHNCADIRKFVVLPGAHYPMEEAPDLLDQELDEFFKG